MSKETLFQINIIEKQIMKRSKPFISEDYSSEYEKERNLIEGDSEEEYNNIRDFINKQEGTLTDNSKNNDYKKGNIREQISGTTGE
jgi:hypothetical protein